MSVRVKTIAPLMVPPKEIADVLSMSVDFIYTEIKGANLRAIRVGREFRVERSEAVRYLEALQAPVPDEWRI